MKIRFIQTCDPIHYSKFMEITSRSILHYCQKYNIEFQSFIGIKCGAQPWHAALNRIPLLYEILQSGYKGWVFYVDADAYIADMSFDLRAYLYDKNDFSLIAAPSGIQPPRWWDINDGVFAINVGTPAADNLINEWSKLLSKIPLENIINEKNGVK